MCGLREDALAPPRSRLCISLFHKFDRLADEQKQFIRWHVRDGLRPPLEQIAVEANTD